MKFLVPNSTAFLDGEHMSPEGGENDRLLTDPLTVVVLGESSFGSQYCLTRRARI